MSKKLEQTVVLKVMRNAGLKPLEDYKGNLKKWKCECLTCKRIVYPIYSNVARGQRGCAYCANRKKDPKDMEALLLKEKLQPLVPYISTHTKWKSRCMKCQSIVYPRIYSLQSGKGGCKYCAVKKRQQHLKLRDSRAHELALKAKVVPLEPYVNMNTKWKSRCQICNKIVAPRLADMKKGMGCKKCSNLIANSRLKLPDKRAELIMQKANLLPLAPYKNSNSTWKCKCLICGQLVSPSLNSIRDGGGCKYCQTGGIQLQEPTYLYLITNKTLKAHKIGVGNQGRRIDRIKRFKNYGWIVYQTWNFNTGVDAIKIEKQVLKIIRNEWGVPIYLKKSQMPVTMGHTETMSSKQITLVQVRNLILNLISETNG